MMRVVIIDCFDSFTYNLYQLVGILGAEPVTITCDRQISDVRDADPDRIILSPGPGTPEGSGICRDVIREFKQEVQFSVFAWATRQFFTAMVQPSRGWMSRCTGRQAE